MLWYVCEVDGAEDETSLDRRRLVQCLQLEQRVARGMLRHPDFLAGSKAVIEGKRDGFSWADAPDTENGELNERFFGNNDVGSS